MPFLGVKRDIYIFAVLNTNYTDFICGCILRTQDNEATKQELALQ